MLHPPLDLSDVSAVVLDVDGTIAGVDHQVSTRTREAMRRLVAAGVPLVLASGRSRRNMIDIAISAGISTPVISCNGAVVTDPVTGENLRVRTMTQDDIDSMITLHQRTGQPLTWWTTGTIFATDEALRDQLAALGDDGIEVVPATAMVAATVTKAMIFGSRDQLDAVQDQVRTLAPRATRSMDEFWELSDREATKWSAVEWVLEFLGGVDPGTVAGAGDGGNDVIWMERIRWPVAMGNARPEVRAVAVASVGHHGDDGAAELLEEILAQRR